MIEAYTDMYRDMDMYRYIDAMMNLFILVFFRGSPMSKRKNVQSPSMTKKKRKKTKNSS